MCGSRGRWRRCGNTLCPLASPGTRAPQRIMPGARGKPQLVRRTLKVKEARDALWEAEIDRRLAGIDMRREAVQ